MKVMSSRKVKTMSETKIYCTWKLKYTPYDVATVQMVNREFSKLPAFRVLMVKDSKPRMQMILPCNMTDVKSLIERLDDGDDPIYSWDAGTQMEICWENGTDLNEEDMTYVVKVTKSWEEAE